MVCNTTKPKKRKQMSESDSDSDPDFDINTYDENEDLDLFPTFVYDEDGDTTDTMSTDSSCDDSQKAPASNKENSSTSEESTDSESDCESPNTTHFNTLNEMISKEIISLMNEKPCECGVSINEENKMLMDIMSNEDLNYFSSLNNENQQKFKDEYENIMKSCVDFNTPTLCKIIESKLPVDVKQIVLKKHITLQRMDKGTGEYVKAKNWIDKLCKIPFNKYIDLPVTNASPKSDIVKFISNTRGILNDKVYGHLETKDQIIRILAQWVSNPKSKGNVIGIHGNPGVGKTTLIKDGVCTALGLPFAFIPLGGAGDSSYLEGHSYTYEGSTCGRIVDVLTKANCMNPVIYFDELDKISNTTRGQEIISLLIHITDPSQNDQFYDKYFSSIPIDLSKCLFIFTYNDENLINPILKDRMISIHTKDYTITDKLHISKHHLFKSVKEDFSLHDITIDDETIRYLITKTQNESGVRNLRRLIELIVSNINVEILIGETMNHDVHIDIKMAAKYTSHISVIDKNPSLSHIYL